MRRRRDEEKENKRETQGQKGWTWAKSSLEDLPASPCLSSSLPHWMRPASRLQGAWENLELIPIISLILLASGSYYGKTAGSSLDAPCSPCTGDHWGPQLFFMLFSTVRALALKLISVLGLSSVCSSQGSPGALLSSSPNAF